MLDSEFMRLAFASGAVIGLIAPVVGFFLVQRRLSLIGDGIGHVAFAGVATGYLLGVSPILTAMIAAVLGGLAIEWLRETRRAAGDQALAFVFYTGIAGGVVIVSAAGAFDVDLFSFLFGSILTVTGEDLAIVLMLGAAVLAVFAFFYRALAGVVVDEEAALVAGVPVRALNLMIVVFAALTVAVSMRIVGLLLIAALMVLPVMAASRVAWSMRSTLGLAMVVGIASVLGGLTIAYYADAPPGGTIVLLAAGAFLATTGVEAIRAR
jgi:zinc transport system permease protein